MATAIDRLRRNRVLGRFAELADLDRSAAATVLRFLAEETGTAAIAAAVVATRTMELADAEPPSARAVLDQITREVEAGDLRFPVSGRSLCDSCHPAQARRLALATLENLRRATYTNLGASTDLGTRVTTRRHLTAVPPPG